MSKSLDDLILEYFQQHPRQALKHDDWVDLISQQYVQLKGGGNPPRDPWRAVRRLHQDGKLIEVKNGVYMYDPDLVTSPNLEDFTPQQKAAILERDNYRCVICGRGKADGVTLHVDHIKPKDLGGKATLDNGQTLCAEHNLRKKNYNQTETGKKMFIRLYELAIMQDDEQLAAFIRDVLEVYEKHQINGHIVWEDSEE